MAKPSKRFILELRRHRCACGADAQHAVNCGSKVREVFRHSAPDGTPCPVYERQDAARRMNRTLALAGLPPEPIPGSPWIFSE